MSTPTLPGISPDDPDLKRWQGYKKIYDILAGNAKERWQCGYNVLQMFLKEYCGVDVPLYTLQLYLRKQARAFKKREGEIANLTPEENLRFGEFTQLEDMAAYLFDIKPFSEEFNDVMYYPALQSINVGGMKKLTVEALFANEGGSYCENNQECKDARQTHLACVLEKTKYKMYEVSGKSYSGGQLFARDWETKGYILKGAEFDKLRSKVAVESVSGDEVKIGGIMTSVSQLFGYEFDRKEYEEDRRFYAEIFYIKLKNYFKSTGSKAGVPVVFNAMIYLIVDATLEPEPSVFMLDPHDMAFEGDKFKDKKKRVPMHYILGSPTGATLFFPPIKDDARERIKKELQDPALVKESKDRFCHLVEMALFNKESYLTSLIKKSVSAPPSGLGEYFRILENYGENVFDNAVLDEICRIFEINRHEPTSILDHVQNLPFSFDLLAEELAHHFPELDLTQHKQKVIELFKVKNVFISLPSFLRNVQDRGLAYKDQMLWHSCIQCGEFINLNRIKSGTGPTARAPFKPEELEYYSYIFRGLLYLFNSQDRYSHVEVVDEFIGNEYSLERYWLLAALGEGLIKGAVFRNFVWVGVVENALNNAAEKLHKVFHGSVSFDTSIDRFLKHMEQGLSKVNEDLLEGIAEVFNEICNYLYLPLDAVLWMVDKLKNRMKKTNIIKRQILVSIAANIVTHQDIKEKVGTFIDLQIGNVEFSYNEIRNILMKFATRLHETISQGIFQRQHVYDIAEGIICKDPERQEIMDDICMILDEMRLELKADMDGLQLTIANIIGNVGMIDNLSVIKEFNDMFRLEGSKESDFASRINDVYREMYERFDFDEVVENISPLSI